MAIPGRSFLGERFHIAVKLRRVGIGQNKHLGLAGNCRVDAIATALAVAEPAEAATTMVANPKAARTSARTQARYRVLP